MTHQKKNSKPATRKNSRAKGKTYERLIAKLLGEWWGEPFRSTPASGGLHWEKDNRVTGDIVPPPDSLFPFSVECKKRENWVFDHLINGQGEIPLWWQQSIDDASRVDKEPLLIFSRNRVPNYVMMHWALFSDLDMAAGLYFKCSVTLPDDSLCTVGIAKLDVLLEKEISQILEKVSN